MCCILIFAACGTQRNEEYKTFIASEGQEAYVKLYYDDDAHLFGIQAASFLYKIDSLDHLTPADFEYDTITGNIDFDS